MNKKYILIGILFIITALYYVQVIKLPVTAFDEGTLLFGAERVMKGQFPYKDFSTAYAPGQITTLAFLYKVFGTSVTTARIYDLIIRTLLSLSIFFIILLLSSVKFGLAGWAMSLIWIARSSFPEYPLYPFYFIIFTSGCLLLLHIRHNRIYYVILCALLIVLSIWFRHDLGVPAAAIFTLVLILRKITGEGSSWKPLVTFLVTVIAVGVPVFLYYAFNSSFEILLNELILNPLGFLQFRGSPYPSLNKNTLSFYIFPFIHLTGVITSFLLIKRQIDSTLAYGILMISLLGIAGLNQIRVRSDMIHLLPAALNCFVSAPLLLYTVPKLLPLGEQQYKAVCILFFIVFTFSLYKPAKDLGLVIKKSRGFIMEVTNPGIRRARYSTIFTDIKHVVPYIQENTSKNDYIYVGVTNHDKFIKNDPLIYFLSERNCPTRYHELNPGVNNMLKIQQEMVSELKTTPPRMVILAPRWSQEPNQSSIDQNIDLLDSFISRNYEHKKSFGMYEVWIKRE